MWVLASPVSTEHRIAIGQAMRVARAVSGLKLETIGQLMGGLSWGAVAQMERGEREPQLSRLYAMRSDPDGTKYVEAFTQEWAALCQIEQTDRLVSEITKLCALVKTRMVRADLRRETEERKTA